MIGIQCRHFDDDGVFFVRYSSRGATECMARGVAGCGRQSSGERGATQTRTRTMAEGLILIPIKGSS